MTKVWKQSDIINLHHVVIWLGMPKFNIESQTIMWLDPESFMTF